MQNSTDALTNLLHRVYLAEGFSPTDIDKLSPEELEMLFQAREDGLVGFAEKISYPESLVEPRIVITSEGYIRVAWGQSWGQKGHV